MDREIAALAARQHGVVALDQLVALGLGDRGVRHRVAAGRLHRIHRAVYAVGHSRLTREGRWMAAVLAAGPGAALSHRAAAGHHGLRAWTGRPSVTVPGRSAARREIEIHRSVLSADEITQLDRIPVTTVPRTIFDCASVLDRHDIGRMIREAERRELSDSLSLPDLLARHPGRRGCATLRAALADLRLGTGITSGELEARFTRFLADAGLPTPERNAAIGLDDRIVVVDCLWRRQRLIVELDGHAFHSQPAQIDADKKRDRDLAARGWLVIRVTWRHLHEDPAGLARDLLHLLASRSR